MGQIRDLSRIGLEVGVQSGAGCQKVKIIQCICSGFGISDFHVILLLPRHGGATPLIDCGP